MNLEFALHKGNKHQWPVWMKVGLFKAVNGRVRFTFRARPLYLMYIYIPYLLKFWVSIEKDVISVMYSAFMKMGKRNGK